MIDSYTDDTVMAYGFALMASAWKNKPKWWQFRKMKKWRKINKIFKP